MGQLPASGSRPLSGWSPLWHCARGSGVLMLFAQYSSTQLGLKTFALFFSILIFCHYFGWYSVWAEYFSIAAALPFGRSYRGVSRLILLLYLYIAFFHHCVVCFLTSYLRSSMPRGAVTAVSCSTVSVVGGWILPCPLNPQQALFVHGVMTLFIQLPFFNSLLFFRQYPSLQAGWHWCVFAYQCSHFVLCSRRDVFEL